MDCHFVSSLAIENDTKVLLVVMDGLGDIQGPDGLTPLEAAKTPNLDALARAGTCGFHDPVAPGITPGSGPAHIGLFGYDPLAHQIGRGVLDTAGTDFEFSPGDLASRINFATRAADGTIADRRAGRIGDDEGRRLVEKIAGQIRQLDGVEVLVQHIKEYRAAVIFRGEKLDPHLCDSDPQKTGLPPVAVKPTVSPAPAEAERAARLANMFIERAAEALSDEPRANFVLLRGFDLYQPLPDFCKLYRWRAIAVASYPMYKGVARIAGMRVIDEGQQTLEQQVELALKYWDEADFIFFHVKKTDSKGEDGDFTGKVEVIEHFDRLLPELLGRQPEVVCITGDHSTPCAMRSHSWHPVPLCISAKTTRRDRCESFSEAEFTNGGLGRIRSTELVPLLLAHAGRLRKFGA